MNNYCSNCGTSIQINSAYCSECGQQLNNSTIPNQEPPSKVVYRDRPIEETKIKSKEKKSFLIGTIIIVLFVLAFTNPIREKHVDEVNQAVKKVLNQKVSKALFDKSKEGNQILAGLGLLFGDELATGIADKFISRKNYIFFSLTEVLLKDEYSTIGIGILGNVIIFKGFEDRLANIQPVENEQVSITAAEEPDTLGVSYGEEQAQPSFREFLRQNNIDSKYYTVNKYNEYTTKSDGQVYYWNSDKQTYINKPSFDEFLRQNNINSEYTVNEYGVYTTTSDGQDYAWDPNTHTYIKWGI
jgi:WD40 repeat protein